MWKNYSKELALVGFVIEYTDALEALEIYLYFISKIVAVTYVEIEHHYKKLKLRSRQETDPVWRATGIGSWPTIVLDLYKRHHCCNSQRKFIVACR